MRRTGLVAIDNGVGRSFECILGYRVRLGRGHGDVHFRVQKITPPGLLSWRCWQIIHRPSYFTGMADTASGLAGRSSRRKTRPGIMKIDRPTVDGILIDRFISTELVTSAVCPSGRTVLT